MNNSYKDGRRFEKGDLVTYRSSYSFMDKALLAEVIDSDTNRVTITFIEDSAIWAANAGMNDPCWVAPRNLHVTQAIQHKERNERRHEAMRQRFGGDIDINKIVVWATLIVGASMAIGVLINLIN